MRTDEGKLKTYRRRPCGLSPGMFYNYLSTHRNPYGVNDLLAHCGTIAGSQRVCPERVEVQSVPGRGAVLVTWIVRGNGPYTITVDSAKGGTVSKRSK